MRHVSLTCKHHPDLRWSCKEIAWTDTGGYNNCRNIFFLTDDVSECTCPASDLLRAPEDRESFPKDM